MTFQRCTRCVIPNSRPDTAFQGGVCSACLSYERRPQIDWDARKQQLLNLLERYGGRCIVPSSGGKDSHYQVLKLLEFGAKPVVVTATTCHLTPIGRANIDNLARYATTYEVTPNRDLRAKLNRMALEMVGDISWPEHVSIFTTPFKMAVALGIPLIFYGENPQDAYGGPPGSQDVREMTRRWVSEFGGFLGLRPSDLQAMGYDMSDYQPPGQWSIATTGVGHLDGSGLQAHFLGQYLEWDSHRNAEVAIAHGLRAELPTPANWWRAENLDNAMTGLHDYGMLLKYGLSRCAQQLSVDIRHGRMARAEAMKVLREREFIFPEGYAGVPLDDVLDRLNMTRVGLWKALDAFTNKDLFRRVIDDATAPPMAIYGP